MGNIVRPQSHSYISPLPNFYDKLFLCFLLNYDVALSLAMFPYAIAHVTAREFSSSFHPPSHTCFVCTSLEYFNLVGFPIFCIWLVRRCGPHASDSVNFGLEAQLVLLQFIFPSFSFILYGGEKPTVGFDACNLVILVVKAEKGTARSSLYLLSTA